MDDRVDLPAPTELIFMPTIVTHGFVAALLGKSFAAGRMPMRFWFLSVLCAILPDADVLGFSLGIESQSLSRPHRSQESQPM